MGGPKPINWEALGFIEIVDHIQNAVKISFYAHGEVVKLILHGINMRKRVVRMVRLKQTCYGGGWEYDGCRICHARFSVKRR